MARLDASGKWAVEAGRSARAGCPDVDEPAGKRIRALRRFSCLGLVALRLGAGLLAGAAFVFDLFFEVVPVVAQHGDDSADDGAGGQEDEFAHGLFSVWCVRAVCLRRAPGRPVGKLADADADADAGVPVSRTDWR